MNKFFSLFVFFFVHTTLQASNLNYVKKANAALQAKLIVKGEEVIQAIYAGGDLSKIKVFDLIATNPKEKKGFFKKIKKVDLSLITKKSKATEEQKAVRREYLAKILAILWKINEVGKKQGVTGSSVSYKVIDGGDKLYRFLALFWNFPGYYHGDLHNDSNGVLSCCGRFPSHEIFTRS